MSTKMICGFWSAIFASASKPSTAMVTRPRARQRLGGAADRLRVVDHHDRRPSRHRQVLLCSHQVPRRGALDRAAATAISRSTATLSRRSACLSTLCEPCRDCAARLRNIAPSRSSGGRTMPPDVIVVMDPGHQGRLDVRHAACCQRRGHRLHYVLPGGLSLTGGAPMDAWRRFPCATTRGLVQTGSASRRVRAGRRDPDAPYPPVDAEYLYDTHILSLARPPARGWQRPAACAT